MNPHIENLIFEMFRAASMLLACIAVLLIEVWGVRKIWDLIRPHRPPNPAPSAETRE